MEVETYKVALEQRRDEIRERIDALERDLKKPHSQDSAEQAAERENEDVLNGLLNDARIEQREIRAALLRMEAGEYGLCANCGEPIDERRLAALPHVTLCIDCAG